jgi:hypothetical protein
MSEARIPFTVGDLKRVAGRTQEIIDRTNAALGPNATVHFSLEVIPGPGTPETPAAHITDQLLRQSSQSTDTAAKSPRRQRPDADPASYSPIEHTLYSVQQFGWTHPSQGNFLMIPKEFEAILLLETKAVAVVVWEIAQQTIGWTEGREPGSRREWAPLTKRHFERAKKLSGAQAQRGITRALNKGYIERRKLGARRYKYRLRWKGSN